MCSLKVIVLSLACLACFDVTYGQMCSLATSCASCITLPTSCFWCTESNFTESRCIEKDAVNHGCTGEFIQNPTGNSTVEQQNDFGGDDFVQVSPQRFSVRLRPGQPQTINVSVQPANNFPVDVYYLMDQSFSMNDDLENLRNLAEQLASTISAITTNFRLGFGSFVDKPRVPYISVERTRLENPCQDPNVRCEPTYSARHTFTLSNDAAEFVNEIQDEIISGNLDSPEGGFDALLQTIVCQDIIGWRDNARHILVYLTDAGFHFAGDGKLGGVVVPHDGMCYLTQRGNVFMYSDSRAGQFDYPSVGQLNSLLRQFDIIPIFAAEATARPFYENLRQVLDSAFVGTLARDSSNIVNLINDTYNTISQTIRLLPDDLPGLEVDIVPMCDNINNLACTGVQIQETANFIVSLSAQSCTEELQNGANLTVRVPGFGQFVVEIEGVCDCECTDNPSRADPICNMGNGDLVCGLCECDPGWVGDRCECSADNVTAVDDCPLGPNGVVCTSQDRGTCICNTCQCNELEDGRRFFGPACECDNFSCDRDDRNLVCGGPTRGICNCDRSCTCLPGWTARADRGVCDCPLSNETCESGLGLQCSNRGSCGCGECSCDEDIFSGPFCEICTGSRARCPENPECTVFRDCVICSTMSGGEECSDVNCTLQMLESSVNTETYLIEGTSLTSFCQISQGGCAYQYFVGTSGITFTSEGTIVELMSVDCSDDGVEPWIIIVAILGGLILLAIIVLIIIRLIIELRYIVEFRQWKKELERARFAKNDNPLFQKATEDFVNPAYGK
ncbi:integrin beta-1-like [Dysidea avara]|uniref:integrin beta-1-like n=1 Tax=Dysidea avara TaxID=196820 RepID=UPI003321771C